MDSFSYAGSQELAQAAALAAKPGAQLFAGGTVLLDLMKLSVMHPQSLVSVDPLRADHGAIRSDREGLHIGGMARMSELESDPAVQRDYPVIAQALRSAASPQIRNMGTIAGTILQRTRCSYFRDASVLECNKRKPGSGCAAIGGNNRHLAVLGVSEHCIAHYPGDLATVLVALGATIDLATDLATRTIALEDLHRLPADRPDIETNLQPGEIITAVHVPAGAWTKQSLYLKIRDREAYAFALASAAVALELSGDTVREVWIGLGGLAAKPWRSHEAEAVLAGQVFDEAIAERAATAAFASAIVHEETRFKPELGRRTLVRALLQAAALENAHA